jgi:hypothetical protein
MFYARRAKKSPQLFVRPENAARGMKCASWKRGDAASRKAKGASGPSACLELPVD